MLGAHHDAARVLRERATQNALADLRYRAPRVLLATTDTALLGGAFLVMEHLPGKVLPAARFFNMSRVLVGMQGRLHALDPEPLLRALDREGATSSLAIDRRPLTFDAYLAQLEHRIAHHSLDGLRAGVAWLLNHRPAEGRQVICHGDLHPYNILVAGGDVTGIVDWPNAIVAEPEFDVAATATILRLAPLEVVDVAAPLRWITRVGRPLLLARYLRACRRHWRLAPRKLSYYEAAACLRQLVRVAEGRVSRAGVSGLPPPTRLDTDSFVDGLAVHFSKLTGIAPELPASVPASVAGRHGGR